MWSPSLSFLSYLTLTLSLRAAVHAARLSPSRPCGVERFSGETTGRYIVKLKHGASKSDVLIESKIRPLSPEHDWEVLNGFATDLDDEALDSLCSHPDVEYIAEDGVMHTMALITQTNAPWGISRLSRISGQVSTNADLLTYTYIYDSSAGGRADVYIIDTGIYTTHPQFEGRAIWGASFGGYANTDGNGHGTHSAGIVGSSQFGVAKAARLIAVKVLSDAGSGSTVDTISGLNWVLTQSRTTSRPSVVLIPFGGGASTSMDNAVAALTAAGVHVVVAAGNDNSNAANYSPARAPSAITVGATTITDAKASPSNYGSVVDVWAPGMGIISTWIGSGTGYISLSGTSMAAAHVAGLVAYLICLEGNVSPAEMVSKLKERCRSGIITGIPSGTINCLVHL